MAKKMARTLAKAQKKRKARGGGSVPDTRVNTHVNMVLDPCNSPIGPTAYRGKDGFITRVSGAKAIGDATAIAALVAYWPRYNRTFYFNLTSVTAGFAIDFYNASYGSEGPGGAFFGTNASEVRPVAACLSSQFTGTELDRQGLLLTGVVPYKAVAGNVTIDTLTQIMQQWQRVPDSQVETKWIPSPSDEDYQAIPSTLPAIYGDDNIVLHVYRGFAAGKLQATARITGIFEWQPFYGLGLSVPTPNTVDPPAGLERVRSTLASYGDWWLRTANRMEMVAQSASQVVRGVGRTARAAQTMLGYARPAVQLLTL